MRVLVVGGGAREHALAWKLSRSPRLERLWCAPGNAGTAALATNLEIAPTDLEGLYRFAKRERIDLTVVGPEAPLVAGIVDRFEQGGLSIVGPTRRAARLEGSKAYAKELMRKHTIPTADARIFRRESDLRRYLEVAELPFVIKADGLAAGKGVYVCHTPQDAEHALEQLYVRRRHGRAADTVLVEEWLDGEEISVHALTDGETIVVLEDARDYKRLLDGDRGPNTGGMGAVSPSARLDGGRLAQIEEQILVPIVHALKREGAPYRGVLYAGLMWTPSGPKVLEWNVRFGDPEAQVLLPRLEGDLLEVFAALAHRRLSEASVRWDARPAVGVVLASVGYPDNPVTGVPIRGVAEAEALAGVCVFHGGTARARDGALVTAGGRVLTVTALGETREAARARAYDAARRIHFEGMRFRTDIAADGGGLNAPVGRGTTRRA
ncbi:MAG: phosphoribosylamine--glycine ligase [Planctomycetota bacterium]|nr:MAG: phosphoribosylamine--glycine ligase [Planctomycetota bacterium]